MPIPQQDGQLPGSQFMTRLRAIGPPAQAPLREALQYQIEPLAVVCEQFERRAAAVGENEQRPQQRIFTQLLAAQSDQSIDAVPKVDSVDGKENTLGRTESEHGTPTSIGKPPACRHIPDQAVVHLSAPASHRDAPKSNWGWQ
jgi:hypothetical protein